ncbi:hypothetical protein HDU99_001719 [Rhizoclosmatium hyalinum]|nr:hypothetical protein HDU99_001719 [Rhizoclosmatium hyalinum]
MNASSDSLVSASSASALRKGRGRTKAVTDPKKVFEKLGYKTVGARLKELMPLMGTKPDSNVTNKREKDKADSLHRFEDAITLAKDVISRKYGMGTVAELKDRLDKCESIPMLCVLLSDVIRETKTKKLNDWVEETRDGGWVEEEEDTTEADEISKGKAANKEKPKLTRRPRKVKNAAASD